jgi:hypothetical protein
MLKHMDIKIFPLVPQHYLDRLPDLDMVCSAINVHCGSILMEKDRCLKKVVA